MQNIFVDILTIDKRFGRMLALEIERLGADVCFGEYRKSVSLGDHRHFVIADLDVYSRNDLEGVGAGCTIIGFSCKDEYEKAGVTRVCNVFLHRPFLMTELLGIIVEDKAEFVARQVSSAKAIGALKTKNNVLRVNPEKRCAVWGNREIILSDNEYRVLEFLCARRGTHVLREEIDALLGVDGGNMSDVYICHLRRKLDNKLGLKLICTVRGKGYMLNN